MQATSKSQEKPPPKSPAKNPAKTPVKESRKRKSVELDDEDDEDVIAPKGKKTNLRKTRKILEDDDDGDDLVPAPQKSTPKTSSAKKSRKILYVSCFATYEGSTANPGGKR